MADIRIQNKITANNKISADLISNAGSTQKIVTLSQINAWDAKVDATDLEDYALVDEAGNKLDLSMDSSTYVLTISLQDKNGVLLDSKNVDLPLETKVDKTSSGVNDALNLLSVGESNPLDADYYISQAVGGGTTTTTYHRRPMSAMWNWIRSKLAAVATSGSYNDLSNKPTIPTVNNATLTILKNGTTVNSFTANASSNVTANITVPTALADLSADATHRLVTDAEKSTWNDKYSKPSAGIPSSDIASIPYLTTAPTSDNNDGLKIVILSSEPSTRYNGYLYLITE